MKKAKGLLLALMMMVLFALNTNAAGVPPPGYYEKDPYAGLLPAFWNWLTK